MRRKSFPFTATELLLLFSFTLGVSERREKNGKEILTDKGKSVETQLWVGEIILRFFPFFFLCWIFLLLSRPPQKFNSEWHQTIDRDLWKIMRNVLLRAMKLNWIAGNFLAILEPHISSNLLKFERLFNILLSAGFFSLLLPGNK